MCVSLCLFIKSGTAALNHASASLLSLGFFDWTTSENLFYEFLLLCFRLSSSSFQLFSFKFSCKMSLTVEIYFSVNDKNMSSPGGSKASPNHDASSSLRHSWWSVLVLVLSSTSIVSFIHRIFWVWRILSSLCRNSWPLLCVGSTYFSIFMYFQAFDECYLNSVISSSGFLWYRCSVNSQTLHDRKRFESPAPNFLH